jgi:hypothetical protein
MFMSWVIRLLHSVATPDAADWWGRISAVDAMRRLKVHHEVSRLLREKHGISARTVLQLSGIAYSHGVAVAGVGPAS